MNKLTNLKKEQSFQNNNEEKLLTLTGMSLQKILADDIKSYYDSKGSFIGILLYQTELTKGYEKQILTNAANNILKFNFVTQKVLPYIDVPDEKYINFSDKSKEFLGIYNLISRYN